MNMHLPFVKMAKAARSSEEEDIIKSLKEIKDSIEIVYDRLNYSQDELITDSLNYELLALKSRHRFYLQKAKELRVKSGINIRTEVSSLMQNRSLPDTI